MTTEPVQLSNIAEALCMPAESSEDAIIAEITRILAECEDLKNSPVCPYCREPLQAVDGEWYCVNDACEFDFEQKRAEMEAK